METQQAMISYPFALQRQSPSDPFTATAEHENGSEAGAKIFKEDEHHAMGDEEQETQSEKVRDDRRSSTDEWDASKTLPSRFQKRKGSIYATPSSRDGHVDKHIGRDAAFHAAHAEKGYGNSNKRAGKGE